MRQATQHAVEKGETSSHSHTCTLSLSFLLACSPSFGTRVPPRTSAKGEGGDGAANVVEREERLVAANVVQHNAACLSYNEHSRKKAKRKNKKISKAS